MHIEIDATSESQHPSLDSTGANTVRNPQKLKSEVGCIEFAATVPSVGDCIEV